MLQWGRSISAAEIGKMLTAERKLQRASMGPQHLSCGNRHWRGRHAPCGLHASMGPQHLSCGNGPSGKAQTAACSASMGPQHLSCGNSGTPPRGQPPYDRFNGAAASQLRKYKVRDLREVKDAASMGPQHLSCGNSGRPTSRSRARTGFNGAAASQLRKSRTTRQRIITSICFNGAAASQLRKS